VSSEEACALSNKAKLFAIELRQKEIKLAALEASHKEEMAIYSRIKNLREHSDDIVIAVNEDTAAPASHPSARAFAGTIPLSPEKPGAHMAHIQLNYRLSNEDRKVLKTKFPGVVWRESQYGNHDHPKAHAETMLCARQAQKHIQKGAKCLDIYGSPASNAAFNHGQRGFYKKRIETLVNEFTEKDALRKATKWGEPMEADGVTPRWIEGTLTEAIDTGFTATFDQFLSIHTLYYMSSMEIARLVNSKPRSVLTAVVHRHKPNSTGYLFGGEMDYVHDGMTVTQTNVETNESYMHRSIEHFWSSKTKVMREVYVDGEGKASKLGYTWGFEKFTEDTWILQITACSATDDEGVNNRVANYDLKGKGNSVTAWRQAFRAANEWSTEVPVARHVPSKTIVEMDVGDTERVGSLLVVCTKSGEEAVELKDSGFFNHLRHQIAGKPRTSEALAGLYSVARRDVSGSTYPGSNKFTIPAEEISDYVTASFLVDAKRENQNLSKVASVAHELKKQTALSKLAVEAMTEDNGTVIRQGLRFATAAVRFTGKDKLATRLAMLHD